jgi:hypothetical protein
VYSAIGDGEGLAVWSSQTNLEIARYNSTNGTVTVEEPFTSSEQNLARQAQSSLLASITAQETAKTTAPPSAQLELG